MRSQFVGVTADDLLTTLRITGSSLAGPSGAVLVGGNGIGGFHFDDQDLEGEHSFDAEAFGAPGIVFRPRRAELVQYETIGCESIAARMGYGPAPLAWRDLRWNRAYPAPEEGTLAFVGYAGSFVAHEDVPASAEGWVGPGDAPTVQNSRVTLYAPYAKNADGVPQKAHVIQLDPSGALQIIQGDGYSVTLDPDNGIVLRDASGESWISMKGGKVEIVAASITLRGVVALGASPEAGIPLLPGPASQPTPSVFFSPT